MNHIEPATIDTGLTTKDRLGARLLVLMGSETGRSYPVGDKVIIGRGSKVSVNIKSEQVSRRHVKITRTQENGFLLEDLGSRNGTRVNNTRVQSHSLRFGDKIQLGTDTVLLFTQSDPIEERLTHSQRMEALGNLAAGVAHEFNNLLSVVLSNLEFLTDAPVKTTLGEPQVVEPLSDATAAVHRASDLTRQLLGLVRPVEEIEGVVDIGELVRQVTHLIRNTVQRKIAVDVQVEEGLSVRGNTSSLHQALMNLAINARDAMPEGGTLAIRARRFEPHEFASTPGLDAVPHVLIEVQDSGTGMTEEVRDRAFDPFFTTKGLGCGTGLGLSFVHKTTKDHKGHVECDTKPGEGATFRIYLPKADVVGESAAEWSTQPTGDFHRHSRCQVLVVDDEPLVVRSTERVLKRGGLDVVCAYNGREALSIYEQQRERIDLVVLDLRMPGLGGEDTLLRLQEIDPASKIVIMSGHCDETLAKHLISQGALEFIRKPWTPQAFMECIHRSLGNGAVTVEERLVPVR